MGTLKFVYAVRSSDLIALQNFIRQLHFMSRVDYMYHDGKDHVAWIKTSAKLNFENKEQRIS